jgi:hypothetical protein
VIVRSKWDLLDLSCEADLTSKETKQQLDGNPKSFNRKEKTILFRLTMGHNYLWTCFKRPKQ